MTDYFIDQDNGLDTNDGLTPTGIAPNAAFKTLNKFTETARAAGDRVTIRRGTTATVDDGGAMGFTSSGTYADLIIAEADYDDTWGDFADSAQTFTPIFGSKTMEASATITGIVAGDWIHADGDDPREYSYEVESVSGTTLTLFIPWKGSEGSGKTMVVMPPNPIWGALTSFAFGWSFSNDIFWIIKGLDIRSSITSNLYLLSSIKGVYFEDCIWTGNTSVDTFLGASGEITNFRKCRWFQYDRIISTGTSNGLEFRFVNCLFNSDDLGTSAFNPFGHTHLFTEECEFQNHTSSHILGNANVRNITLVDRNSIFDANSDIFGTISNTSKGSHHILIEDFNGENGKSIQHSMQSFAKADYIVQSDMSVLRDGGGIPSILIIPSIQLGPSRAGRYEVFNYPVLMTVDIEKTFTFFSKSNDIAQWTANPTNLEFWAEMDYWGHATNNFRKTKRSTDVVDFLTDTNFDKSISITVTPAQSGIAYLRLYYGKSKESGKDNKFYIDPVVVVS